MLAVPDRPSRPRAGDGGGLAEVLGRCARREPGAERELEERCGPRLRAVLRRALGGDPERAEAALPAVLADLREGAAGFDPARQPAEDWVFGRARRVARELPPPPPPGRPGARPPPPPLARLPSGGAGAGAVAASGTGPGQAAAGPAPDPAAGRPPSPSPPPPPAPSPSPSPAVPLGPRRRPTADGRVVMGFRRGRRLATLAAVLAAGTLAAAGIVVLLDSLPTSPPPPPAAVTTAAAPVPPASPPLSPPAEPAPGPAAGGRGAPPLPPLPSASAAPAPALPSQATPTPTPPLPAVPPAAVPPEPPTEPPAAAEALPPPTEAAAPEPAVTRGVGAPRVFVHYDAASAAGAALARQAAERLARAGFEVAGVRRVPLRIRRGSVRYFFPGDRAAAARLREATGPAAGALADFTRHDPKPTPGTVELWVAAPS